MSSDVAMCAVHADAPSVVTCHRCGRFCCERCMQPGAPCNDCVARAAREVPPLEPRAKLARYALYAMGGLHASQAGIEALQLAFAGSSSAAMLELMNALVLIPYIPLYITSIVLICRWFHLAARHALARNASLDATPAGAVWSWFIPFVNLARPFSLARSMLSSAGADPGLVTPWQTAWIIGNLITNFSVRVEGPASVGAGFLGDVLLAAAAVLGAKVIAAMKFR